MATTLLLDRSNWDCCVDAAGNIAVASEPYSQAQDVSSECRVFSGECYYDIGRGIPFFAQILGRAQPVRIVKEQLGSAARRVPGVTDATVFLTEIDRTLAGQVQFRSASGVGVAAI